MVSLPPRLPYFYSIQFIDVWNRNNPINDGSLTTLMVCEGNHTFPSLCQTERYRIPVRDGVLPQSLTIPYPFIFIFFCHFLFLRKNFHLLEATETQSTSVWSTFRDSGQCRPWPAMLTCCSGFTLP
jgi:hypothetical protein